MMWYHSWGQVTNGPRKAVVPPPGVAALSVRIGVSVHQFRTAASNYQL